MKRFVYLGTAVLLLLWVSVVWAIPLTPPGIPTGTLTDTKGCIWTAGVGLVCNSDFGTGSVAADTIWDAAGDLVQGTGANTAAKLTKGAEGTVLRAGAASNAYSTFTIADSFAIGTIPVASGANTLTALAAGGAGKLLMGAGAATPAWTTPTFPNAATTTGAYLRADGTNFIQSTLVLPNAGTAFKLPVFSAANTMTELAAVGATGEVLMGATGAIPAWTASPTLTGTITAAAFNTTRVASDSVSLTNAQYLRIYEDIDDGNSYVDLTVGALAGNGKYYLNDVAFYPNAADTVDLGGTANEWANLYLGDGAIIYGQNNQNNTITSSADNWNFALDIVVTGLDITLGATGVKFTSDNDGALTLLSLGNGYVEDLNINLDDTENTAKFSSSTGVTTMDFSALHMATTGQVSGRVVVVEDNNGKTLSGTDLYGSMQLATGAGTWVIPDVDAAAGTGQSFCVYTTGINEIVIAGDAEDKIRLAGTLGAAGGDITNNTAEAAGDFICLMLTDFATDVAHWTTLGYKGTWTVVP